MPRPYITIKFAQTLDGKIAAVDASSRWISGPEARRFAHRLRARSDAVLVGVGTVLADDPALTVRLLAGRNPARIVIDGRLRIPLDSRIVTSSHSVRTIVVTGKRSGRKIEKLREKGVEIVSLSFTRNMSFPRKRESINVRKVLPILYKKGLRSILVEGGKGIIASFLKAGLVDEIIAIISPKILGKGVESVGDLGIRTIGSALKLRLKSVKPLGGDVICYYNVIPAKAGI